MSLERMTLAEVVKALSAGTVRLDAALVELATRPCLDRDWRPGDALRAGAPTLPSETVLATGGAPVGEPLARRRADQSRTTRTER